MRILLPILCLLISSCSQMLEIPGCKYENALNYYEYATIDDGSCKFQEIPKSINIEGKIYQLSKENEEKTILFALLESIFLFLVLIFSMIAGLFAALYPLMFIGIILEGICLGVQSHLIFNFISEIFFLLKFIFFFNLTNRIILSSFFHF